MYHTHCKAEISEQVRGAANAEEIDKHTKGGCDAEINSHAKGIGHATNSRLTFVPLALALALAGAMTLSACSNSNAADEETATSGDSEVSATSEVSENSVTKSSTTSENPATSGSTETSAPTRVYENESFYVDAPEALTVTIADACDNTWKMNIDAGDYGGGTHLIHVDSVSADEISANNKYAWVMGTTSSGRTVWVEELAGGGFININGDGATRLSVFVGVK